MNDQALNAIIMAISIYYIVGAGILRIGFNSKRTQRLISKIGEGPTRIFYIVLGIVFFILSYLKVFN
ncbi:hypothetical protein RJG79_11275 [Mycoplasmatota bacterium WC44]